MRTLIKVAGRKRPLIYFAWFLSVLHPFKNGKKYISESDGCVKGKTGAWCATKVNKEDDYKIESFGYCK